MRAKKIINNYSTTTDNTFNSEFFHIVRVLQQIDPDAPSGEPPHISELLD